MPVQGVGMDGITWYRHILGGLWTFSVTLACPITYVQVRELHCVPQGKHTAWVVYSPCPHLFLSSCPRIYFLGSIRTESYGGVQWVRRGREAPLKCPLS